MIHQIKYTLPALLFFACPLSSLQAGLLSETYQNFTENNLNSKAVDYLSLAAEEEVNIARKEYYPRLSMQAMQLAVGQDIRQSGTAVFQEGYDDFGNTRFQFQLDQPIVDLTLKYKVASAEASKEVVAETKRLRESEQTQYFVFTILNAARFATLENAMGRVIDRMERESRAVTKNFHEKLATVEDLENVRTAFSAMQQERRAFQQQLELSLFELGLDASLAQSLILDADSALDLETSGNKAFAPQVSVLQAEIDVFDSRIKATRLKDAPRLSLYGLYEFDDAGGSQFGGERTLNGYEVGVALRWDLFDRGINRAEARRLSHLKMAKQSEIQALPSQQERKIEFSKQKAAIARKSLDSLEEQIASHQTILKATERAYEEGGDKSYINMVNVFLTYEALLRQQIHGKFDYLQAMINVSAAESGWRPELVHALDKLFVQESAAMAQAAVDQ